MTRGSSPILADKNNLQVVLNEEKVETIRSKLSDGKYMYGAICCLASVLTDKVMDLGGGINASEEKN